MPLYEALSEVVGKMTITKNSLVLYKYRDDMDYGVISEIVNKDGFDQYWSAWRNYYPDCHSNLESLTLIGPSILGAWNDE